MTCQSMVITFFLDYRKEHSSIHWTAQFRREHNGNKHMTKTLGLVVSLLCALAASPQATSTQRLRYLGEVGHLWPLSTPSDLLRSAASV